MMIQGYKPSLLKNLESAPMRVLESGWAVSEVFEYEEAGRALCFMRGSLVLYFYFLPLDKRVQPGVKTTAGVGTLMGFSQCCGYELGRDDEQVPYWACTACGKLSEVPRTARAVVAVDDFGNLARQSGWAAAALSLHAGNVLQAEFWFLELQAHLEDSMNGIPLFKGETA